MKVIIADDHRLLREGLTLLLRRNGFEVVAEAADGRTAVKLAKKFKPGAMIMDISMPELNGIDATTQVCRESPATKIIIMSMHRDSHFVLGALKAGACGYVLKDAGFDEVALALNAVAQNGVYLSPAVAGVVLNAYIRKTSLREPTFEPRDISGREREVLQLLAEGKSTQEIATSLFVSAKTVATHRKEIMNKLDIDSIAGLTKYAIREGLTSIH